MKSRKLILSGFFIMLFGLLSAQNQTTTYEVTFRSENQNMWSDPDFEINIDVNLFDVNWNQSGGFDGIRSIVGQKFGAGFNAATSGNMGMDFYLKNISGGTIEEVNYPVKIDFTVPETNSFKAGETITIESDFIIDPSASMNVNYPINGKTGANVSFDMNNNISVEGCMSGCGSTSRNMPVNSDMDLFQISSKPGETFYPALQPPTDLEFLCYTPPSVIPYIKYDDNPLVDLGGSEFFTGSLQLPNVSIENFERNPDNSLVGTGNSHYINSSIDITRTLLSFSPYRLENTIAPPIIGCAAGLKYKIMSAEVMFDAINHQEFKFEPSIKAKIELPSKVEYRVLSGNRTVKTGISSVIEYKVGHTLEIKFPCNFEYLDLKPEFQLRNKFTNHTFDVYDVNLKMEALEFGIEFQRITVVPSIEICLPIVGCSSTPAVVFNPPDLMMGPLWSRTFNIGTITRDWHKDSWELGGFQKLEGESFRISPERFTVELESSDIKCNGASTGSINLKSSREGLSYKWSDGSNEKNLTNVKAGNYYVKVIDQNGCEIIKSARISQPEPLVLDYNTQDNKCYNDETGSISLNVEGGTGNYTFEWTGGFESQNLTNIAAGDYEVKVTDEKGCYINETITVKQPTPLTSAITDIQNPLCNGNNNGYIKTNVEGGTGSYRFEWDNGSSRSTLNNIGAGSYSVTVYDENECSVQLSANLTDPEVLAGNLTVVNEVSCYMGDDGEIKLNISGGSKPYDIIWYSTQNTLSNTSTQISGLHAGEYRVEVTDANGCFWESSVNLDGPKDPFYINLTEYHLTCHNGADGAIDVEVVNGTPPFSYHWSDGSREENGVGLTAGRHSVSVTDASGCIAEARTVLLEPRKISIESIIKEPSCINADDAEVEIIPSGGNAPYSVEWSSGHSGFSIEDLKSGSLTATVTDNYLCVEDFEIEIPQSLNECITIPNAFTPNDDGINDTWEIEGIEFYPNYNIKIFTKWGELIYSASADDPNWDGTFKGKRLPSATYYYVIDLGDGSSLLKGLVTIIR
ncbi:gliding motility-associated C-terminal domain-containing protein [Marinilabiliaceae bacterium ANBcel2]|nr:gliding motility-associated C-terminal domain-containing protein [Marinilabiliaceae bacterium ANBcel2]